MKNLLDIWRPERFNPFRELSTLQRQMDRLLDEFNRYEPSAGMSGRVDFVPACDVEENDDSYVFSLDLPGMPREQLQVQVSGNTLTVSGEKKEETKEGKGRRRSYESYRGRFERSFTLPDISEASKIEADYQDGVLRILVPKAESAKAKTRRIAIGEGKSHLFNKPSGKAA